MKYLPLTHVTPWENFVKILNDGFLIPHYCNHFNEELIYLSYGRLAYKPSKKDYNWNENSPVVIYFDSFILPIFKRFFPFDTGAILTGRFKNTGLNRSNIIEKFTTNENLISNPQKWLNSKYNTSKDYIGFKYPDNIKDNSLVNSLLKKAYNQMKICNELDYRLTSIECQSNVPISIQYSFMIAIPFDKEKEFNRLNRFSNLNIMYYKDHSENGYLPKDLSIMSNKIFLNNNKN